MAWLWEAGLRLGITGDEQSAVAATAQNLAPGQVACVEQAILGLDRNLLPDYQRTGIGQVGRLVAGSVFWDDLRTAART